MNTEEIMKLADAYAAAYMSFSESKARAALEAALSAKQGEQALQDVSDPAPSVNAQERISELEAQNERLWVALKVMVDNFGLTPSDKVIGLGEARAAIAAVESLK